MIIFTGRYKIPKRQPPKLNGIELTLKDHAKYLGVILDNKLSWKHNILQRKKRASKALYACKIMLGVMWGLLSCSKANITLWYSSVVDCIEKSDTQTPTESTQRLGALCTIGAIKTTPTAAHERILNLLPIDITAEGLAARSAARLNATSESTSKIFGHSSIGMSYLTNIDFMTPKYNWVKRFRTTIEEEGLEKRCDT